MSDEPTPTAEDTVGTEEVTTDEPVVTDEPVETDEVVTTKEAVTTEPEIMLLSTEPIEIGDAATFASICMTQQTARGYNPNPDWYL